ncbi:hypothetical protein B0F90DRAFT_1719994 [Multifurca ochricompacta]|uniref:Secreted protein n=1 Tax=Multifurca ochricompacta TaxID=376703 RepID=A0AAD4M4Q2_9AGAM|nr:hypothetical protein B0F90DRAFT_1719994 [Multifurca ochricompacta]
MVPAVLVLGVVVVCAHSIRIRIVGLGPEFGIDDHQGDCCQIEKLIPTYLPASILCTLEPMSLEFCGPKSDFCDELRRTISIFTVREFRRLY